MPDRVIGIEPDEPAEQQVEIQLLNQHPFGADPVDSLQHQGQKQLLRRDRGSAALGVEAAEGGIEAIQGLICQPPHLPERMGSGDPLLSGNVGEQRSGSPMLAAHPLSAGEPFSRGWISCSAASKRWDLTID